MIQETLAALNGPALVSGALPGLDSELWLGELVAALGDRETEFQVQERDGTHLYAAGFRDCLMECATASHHDSAVFVLDEDLLGQAPERLREELALPIHEWGRNWFLDFPGAIQPSDCLLIGGEGGRSTLHADPFSWQGYNYLLEGRKLWTFMPPSASASLGAYRLEPNAWGEGEDRFGFAAGWQSPVDLYRDIEDRDDAAGCIQLAPHLSFCPSHELDSDILDAAITFVQEEGELLLIPPDWWHQTYHMSATVAVASQMMNRHVARSVFGHILDWTGTGRDAVASWEELEALPPREQIERVLLSVCCSRYGNQKGPEVLRDMWSAGCR